MSNTHSAPVIYTNTALESLHYVRTERRIFRRPLSAKEQEEALQNYHSLSMEAAGHKERGKEEVKWLSEHIPAIDAQSIQSRNTEIKMRTGLAAAEAKLAEANAEIELQASSVGFRWEEVDVRTYADDVAREMVTVRADTLLQINRRRMSISEAEGADARLQGDLFPARH